MQFSFKQTLAKYPSFPGVPIFNMSNGEINLIHQAQNKSYFGCKKESLKGHFELAFSLCPAGPVIGGEYAFCFQM